MALSKEQLTTAKTELESEICRLQEEIHGMEQKLAAVKVLLGETPSLTTFSGFRAMKRMGVMATYPNSVKRFLRKHPGELFTVTEIAAAVAKLKNRDADRNFTISISTTCARLDGKHGISRGLKDSYAAYVFNAPLETTS